jgi:hypothetical protein
MKLETFVRRHEFCITPIDVLRDIRRSGRTPKKVGIVCNHMPDGYCIHEIKEAIHDGFVEGLVSLYVPAETLDQIEAREFNLDMHLDQIELKEFDECFRCREGGKCPYHSSGNE